MIIENNKNQEQREVESPFIIEQYEGSLHPEAKIEENRLFIDGELQNQYLEVATSWGTKDDLKKQKNDPNLVQFQAKTGNGEGEGYRTRVIDITNPTKELLIIGKDDRGNISVNGQKWNSLRDKDIYWGGYRVEVDPEGKKIVFVAGENNHRSDSKYSVIVNNEVWNTKFDNSPQATSVAGVTYAFGGSGDSNKLVVDDKEWKYNRFKSEKYHNGGDEITNAKMSKGGTMVAIVQSLRAGDNSRRYISVGDKVGEKIVWKNTFVPNSYENPNLIAVDDVTGHIAVFGRKESEGKPQLLIDDIPYDIPGNPERLEFMDFRDGGIVIKYMNALGEEITNKVSLRKEAKEFQEVKEKREANENAFIELRKKLSDEHIPIEDIIGRLKIADNFDQELKKNEILQGKLEELREKNIRIEMELKEQTESNNVAAESFKKKITEQGVVIQKLENILRGAKDTTFGSDKKLSADSVTLALSLIKEITGKNYTTEDK